MRNRKSQPSRGNRDRWLITYADMITLLMIFFILMYTLSNVDAQKFRALSQSLSKAMGGGDMILNSPGPSITEETMQEIMPGEDYEESVELVNVKKQVESLLSQNGLSNSVTVTTEPRGLVVSFQDPVLFAQGSADLTPSARQIIYKVGKVLFATPNYIRIEGHTDNVPISNSKYPSNWELSVARSTSVLRELITKVGFQPQRLSASGYGEYRPRAPNTSDYNRQSNRRVSIVILDSKYDISEPGAN